MNLETLLHQTFGHKAFRANQEAVCQAATDGRDVLLVMPTGAGKSLCYQLPAIARGGTALVVSPLIALMDDQAAKLSALGLKVARIHSGLSRDESRQACRDYLDGTLQFLFIAPERMRVPGFPEMLARKKPALIAIDEAHCISAWGHDFRPDYRTLGDYLPALRPAPILALTATATPTVQKDIVTQLQLTNPKLFIHGFRRHNLAIEVVELSKPQRNDFTVKLLSKLENRPAIVYAPSRKSAEELASKLGGKAAAYHAGLDPATRERVQRHFLTGRVEVVVATIAFGMGIDKADVRTVVHIALPGSVEAYYQEIGRAGRDGQPSRTVLLHSFADRKMHDFFLERDYPAATELSRVANLLTPDFQMPSILAQRLKLDAATFDRTIQKLAAQGAAALDFDGNVRGTGVTTWRSGYDQQLAFRRSQIDRMVAYAGGSQCRMTALIHHFGDTADGQRPCGNCDFCSPERATAQPFRAPTQQETRQLNAILRALDGSSRSTGKLHADLSLGIDRNHFEAYLDALTRAGLITLISDTFTNADGNAITYKKAALTHEGRNRDEGEDLAVVLRDAIQSASPKSRGARSSSTKSSSITRKASAEPDKAAYTPAQKDLEARLREWRKAEAAKTGKPAFIVFSDSILHNIVLARPTHIPDLQTISGIGPEKADRYGAAILALCNTGEVGEQSIPGDYGIRNSSPPMQSSSRPKAAPLAAVAERRPHSALPADQPDARYPSRPPHSALPADQPDARYPSRPPHSALPADQLEARYPSRTLHSAHSADAGKGSSAPTATRARKDQPAPEEPLTPEQSALDQRLRDWRKSEAERLGLPQFFVCGTSTLRCVVLKHPRTLDQLRSIAGLGPEKLEKFGAGILAVCNA